MGFAEKVISHYASLGYRFVEKIPPWRFFVAILEKDGRKYFLKVGQKSSPFFKDKPLDEMWSREEKLMSFINSRLSGSDQPALFRLAEVIDRGQNEESAWTLFEYLSGPHIIDTTKDGDGKVERWLPTIINILQWFDRLEDEGLGTMGRDLTRENIEKVTEWSKKPLNLGILKPGEVGQALAVIKELGPTAETRLQHGDFVPWHMHDDGFPRVVLIDLEGARPRFRYYDLAYVYHRLYTKRADPPMAKRLLNLFLESVQDKVAFARWFQLPLVNRAIGGLQDYCNEYPDRTKESNEEHLRLQRQFLENVFSGKIAE